MKDVGTTQQKIGEKLKQVRIKKNLTIADVSKELKIRQKYIKAIETDDYSQFSAQVYAKGFVKNYAKFLGLDVDKYVKLFRREVYEEFEDDKAKVIHNKNNILNLSFLVNQKKVSLMIVAVCFFIALIWFSIRFYNVTQKPNLILNHPLVANARELDEVRFDTTLSSITISGEIEHGNKLFLNGERIETLGFKDFEISELYLEEGENTFVISTENEFGIVSEINLTVIKSMEDLSD